MVGRPEAQRSAAYGALSVGGKLVLKVIEDDVRRGSGAITLDRLMEQRDLCRSSVRRGIRQCEALGFVSVSMGFRRVGQFQLSDRWRALDADEAARLVKLAKSKTPPRATSAPPKPVRPVKARVEVEQPPPPRQPSMPVVAWIALARLNPWLAVLSSGHCRRLHCHHACRRRRPGHHPGRCGFMKSSTTATG
jgi:hypothetical protein